jgi:GNAT superfamily N-acetyltransferase
MLVRAGNKALLCHMDFNISPVTMAELPELLELVRELARFERLEHEVKATVESFENSFFGPQPVAGALLARCGEDLAGYAIYFFTFSSFIGRPGLWLDDVYVRPKFRQRRLGLALMESVARIGVQRNCGRFEWTALNWNKSALDFYMKLDAQVLDEWVLLRLNEHALRRLGSRKSQRRE